MGGREEDKKKARPHNSGRGDSIRQRFDFLVAYQDGLVF